jgi:hypothetical protein
MHNDRVRASLAAWTVGSGVTDVEWDKFDQRQFESVNGDLGGVWEPADEIILGGAGLRVTGLFGAEGFATFYDGVGFNDDVDFNVGSMVEFHDDVEIGDNSSDALLVQAFATFDSFANFNGFVTFFGDAGFNEAVDFNLGSVATFHDTVQIGDNDSDDLTVNSTANFDGPVDFDDTVSFDTTVAFGGPVTHSDPIILVGDARIRERTTIGANADTTYSVEDFDVIYVPDGTLSAARVYDIATAGAVAGDKIRVVNRDDGFDINVWSGGSPIAAVGCSSGGAGTLDLQHISGAWRVVLYVTE